MCVPTTEAAAAAVAAAATLINDSGITAEKQQQQQQRQRQLSWREKRKQSMDALNERVAKLTKKAVANAEKTGTPLDPEYVYAQKPMTIVSAGTPIYQVRSACVVYLYTVFACVLVVSGIQRISLLATVLSVVIMFVGYDLYSGVLHVVLDHPDNIGLPVLGQPCLEFQWHHAIPDDLVRKHFVDVCGDLNIVILILAVFYSWYLDIYRGEASGVAMVIGGMKLLMAYFGQFSHRSAHAFGSERPPVADWLQRHGFMISAKDHLSHHKPPHDNDFCLIGLCNPVIDAMREVTTNRRLWLTVFLAWSFFDLVLYVRFVEWVNEKISA